MVDPKLLCRKHLLGEHNEIHKHRHNFIKKHSIKKRIELGQIEPKSMKTRHDQLALEMIRRGYKHESPYQMPDISYLPIEYINFTVDIDKSHEDLINRCEDCKRIKEKTK